MKETLPGGQRPRAKTPAAKGQSDDYIKDEAGASPPMLYGVASGSFVQPRCRAAAPLKTNQR